MQAGTNSQLMYRRLQTRPAATYFSASMKTQKAGLFELACADMEHKGSISTASRLLAMKRPDVFVCKSGENVERLAHHFGCAKSFGADDYWSKIVGPMMETSWWKTSPPKDYHEIEIWNGRAALLDMLYWVGKKRQLPSSSA